MKALSELLKGDYGGLHEEVVVRDVYGLRKVPFTPTLIFDIGANIGIFSRYARGLWPEARIVAVEPHPENAAYYRRFSPPEDDEFNTTLCQMALGRGQVYHFFGARNGSGEVYLTESVGYPTDNLRAAAVVGGEQVQVPSVSLDILFQRFRRSDDRVVLKIDCEGAENCIWLHEPSFRALASSDYIAMELHSYAATHALVEDVKAVTEAAIRELSKTHTIHRDHVHLQAMRNFK